MDASLMVGDEENTHRGTGEGGILGDISPCADPLLTSSISALGLPQISINSRAT